MLKSLANRGICFCKHRLLPLPHPRLQVWELGKKQSQSTVTDLVDGDAKGYFNSPHVVQIIPSG